MALKVNFSICSSSPNILFTSCFTINSMVSLVKLLLSQFLKIITGYIRAINGSGVTSTKSLIFIFD